MKCVDLNTKRKRALAVRLPSYEPFNILIRMGFASIIAIWTLHIIIFVVGSTTTSEKSVWFYYLIIISAYILALELQIVLDNILERYLPIPNKIKLRIFLQLTVGLLMLFILSRGMLSFIDPDIIDDQTRVAIFIGFIVGLLFIQMIATSLTVARFTQKWLDSQEELADMKREKLRMDYNSLQDQLNPHFLFNNLSVLKSLIIYDQKGAINFTENFTDVYRYVLQSKDKRLVRLSEEIEFIESYIALHQERLGDGLEIKLSSLKESMQKEIAPLTLQLLVENAIKHNITCKETPLQIEIDADEHYLTLSNNLNFRDSSCSTKTGLKNLVKRYEILTDRELLVQHNEERFEVKVPLL